MSLLHFGKARRATVSRWRNHVPRHVRLALAGGISSLILVFACQDQSSIVSPTKLEVLPASFALLKDPSYSQQEYEQQVAESVAPVLMFDQDQGERHWGCPSCPDNWYCFPQDAGDYYEKRRDGIHFRMCCLIGYACQAEATIAWGGWSAPPNPFPTYYIYDLGPEELRVAGVNGVDGAQCAPLLAGRNREVGALCAEDGSTTTNREFVLRLTLTANPGWEITEAQLWAGEDLAEMPQTQKGNPKVGQFPYRVRDAGGFTSHSFDVPVSGSATVGDHVIQLASHAVVREDNGSQGGREEGAWAEGAPMVERGNWATHSTVEFAISRTEYVMYWWFYGWNNYCGGTWGGEHHADWERVNVKVVDGQLDRVMFFQHSGWYTKNPFGYEAWKLHLNPDGVFEGGPRQAGVPGEYHPFVYVGKAAHGSYHDSGGGAGSTCCYWQDYRNPGTLYYAKKGFTWLNLVPLTDDEGSPEWMKYDGEWGGCCWDDYGGYGYDGIRAPLFQSYSDDPGNIPGCEGGYTDCWEGHQQGCERSDVRRSEIM